MARICRFTGETATGAQCSQDTLRQMREDGITKALAFMTSAFSSYSGCRQYQEDVSRAQAEVGDGAPHIDKLRVFFNHPGFIEAVQDRVRIALDKISTNRRGGTRIVFTAHSLPNAMASGCAYEQQLNECCRLVTDEFSGLTWKLVYQSRSGPPMQPWLEPDICDYLQELASEDEITDVVVVPIGFISDHMEVVFDLDTEAKQVSEELGLNMIRAGTVGTHPRFIQMIRDLILERTAGVERLCVGELGIGPDVCPPDCCPSGRPPAHPSASSAPVT